MYKYKDFTYSCGKIHQNGVIERISYNILYLMQSVSKRNWKLSQKYSERVKNKSVQLIAKQINLLHACIYKEHLIIVLLPLLI